MSGAAGRLLRSPWQPVPRRARLCQEGKWLDGSGEQSVTFAAQMACCLHGIL